jgi:hypothetical protein
MKTRLTKVKAVKRTRNVFTEEMFDLPIKDFLMECYDRCSPSKYGLIFPKKLKRDLRDGISILPNKIERGDLHVRYKTFFEVKISFRNHNGKFSITHIRSWQKFDYYIICFVDTEKDFSPKFYCVPKDVVTNNPKLSLSAMNNTQRINRYNSYVDWRTSFNCDDVEWIFEKENVLSGTKYTNLIKFIKSLNKKQNVKK